MPCMCQYEYTNIVPSNGTKIVRLGYLFTYVDEVLDMQGEAESSIFSISYPVTHVAPILGRTLSAVLGLAGLGLATLVYGMSIGLVIGSTLFLICSISATVGGLMPIVAKTIGADPAVFSNPFISTFCDATGLIIYFLIAKTVLGI